MADHYDTAYMARPLHASMRRRRARARRPGADDNHSATAALMLAAPIFLEMSQAGQLGCDVWLVHLTGEEFPADCLGRRAPDAVPRRERRSSCDCRGAAHDLSEAQSRACTCRHGRPQQRPPARRLPDRARATAASRVGWRWRPTGQRGLERAVPDWNQHPEAARPAARRAQPDGAAIPELAAVPPALSATCGRRDDPRSTLFNTDGQIFSDAGMPVVLFMEDYDIDRSGYHDSHDTMAEHRPRLRRGAGGDRHRGRGACGGRDRCLSCRVPQFADHAEPVRCKGDRTTLWWRL